MYEYEVYLSNPTCVVTVYLDTQDPSHFDLLQAAIEVISDDIKLDSYKEV